MFGGLIVVLAVLIGTLSYVQFSSVGDRVLTVAKLSSSTELEGAYSQALMAYRIRLRSLIRDRGVSSTELTITLRCSLRARQSGTWSCPERAAFGSSTLEPDWASWLTVDQRLVNGKQAVIGRTIEVSSQQSSLQTLYFELRPANDADGPRRRLGLRLGSNSVFRNAITGNSLGQLFLNTRIFGDAAQYHPFQSLHPTTTTVYGRLLSAPPHALPGGTLNRPGWYDIRQEAPGTPEFFPTSAYPADDRDTYVDYMVGIAKHCRPIPTERRADFGGIEPNGCVDYVYSTPSRQQQDLDRLVTYQFIDQYDGPNLEWNFMRQEFSLPKLNPDLMANLSTGSIRASMIQVPKGSRFGNQSWAAGVISARASGHLLLDGRQRPIEIRGRVSVDGDLVIMGRVKGRGSIYVRGTIFIPADLTYHSNSPHFSGSSTALATMAQVGTRGQEIAAEMESSADDLDRLALYSTNHVIVGNPFASVPGVADQSLADINWSNLRRYTGDTGAMSPLPDEESNLVIDTRTGEMLDVQVLSGSSQRCVLRPWQPIEECQPIDDPSMRPHLKFVRYDTRRDIDLMTDKEVVEQASSLMRGEAYRTIFEPNDWTISGSNKNWLSRDQYFALTVDPADPHIIRSLAKDSDGRRGLGLQMVLIPDRPYQPAEFLNPDTLADQIDAASGAFSEAASTQIADATNAASLTGPLIPPTPRSLTATIKDALRRCQQSHGSNWVSGSPTPNIPDLGLHWPSMSRMNYLNPPNPQPMVVNGVPQTGPWSASGEPPYSTVPLVVAGQECYIFSLIDEEIELPGPSGPLVSYRGLVSDEVRVNPGFMNGSTLQTYFAPRAWTIPFQAWLCGDHTLHDGSGTFNPSNIAFSSHPFSLGPCRPRPSQHRMGDPFRIDARTPEYWSRSTGDFEIATTIHPTAGHFKVSVVTSFWNPSRVRLKTPVRRIDAFLFANHFIGLATPSTADRQLRVHGGLVARDIFGLTPNVIGPGRQYIDGRYRTQSATSWPIAGNMPGLWIVQDPRFQFREDLFDTSFLSVISAR